MKIIFSIFLTLISAYIFAAAPLESGYTLAPKASASQDEKTNAYIEARTKVINAAVRYENTPYLYGGMTSRGLDCSGLICLSFKDALGVDLPRSASGLYSWAEKIPIDQAQPGDFLFFKTDNSGGITHVALYLGGGRFIHSASEGPNTGVIYSTIDESYWARTYAGAGRVFPEAPNGAFPDASITENGQSRTGNFDFNVAFAPSWNGFSNDGSFFRGFSSCIGVGLYIGQMSFGFELRPEYDRALGVFRLPLTLSWSPNEKIRVFAGPVLSFGNPSITAGDSVRYYSGGTSWLGAVGISFTPFTVRTSLGNFSPYLEVAWQNYYSKDAVFNFNTDASAFLRLSTGIRYMRNFR